MGVVAGSSLDGRGAVGAELFFYNATQRGYKLRTCLENRMFCFIKLIVKIFLSLEILSGGRMTMGVDGSGIEGPGGRGGRGGWGRPSRSATRSRDWIPPDCTRVRELTSSGVRTAGRCSSMVTAIPPTRKKGSGGGVGEGRVHWLGRTTKAVSEKRRGCLVSQNNSRNL